MTRGRSPRSLDPGRLRAELRRILTEVVRDVDDVIRRPRPTPGSLHRLHRAMRGLRTALAIWGELLGEVGKAQLRPLEARIRRLTRLVGQVRDRDVAVRLLEEVEKRAGSEEEQGQLRQYRSRLEEDARTGRELLRAFLRSERQARLFDHVGEAFELRTRALARSDLRRVLADHQRRGREKVATAHRRARRRPSMNRLHRLRIRVRRLRQMSDLASAVDPGHDPALAESLRRLQQHLGHLHDLDVLLHDLDPALLESEWAGYLRKERRQQRKAITKVLKSRKPIRAPVDPREATDESVGTAPPTPT
ncbi:MAG TPA: CHAD domain-containing protein [Thermoplasmata archaeon]|nr:CHAD domain-containing protein [Thermoplasmata archaeon]